LRPLEGRYPYLFLDADISVADASTIIARTRFDRCLAPVEIRFSRCASAAESGRTNTSGGRIHHLLDRDASQPADSEAARLLAADQADREEEQARLDPEALERHEGPDQAAASVGNDGKPIDVESQAQLQVYLDSKAAQH
jgi:hypothetical protein